MGPPGRAAGEELLDTVTAVDRRAIPDDEQLAREVAQEMTEEGDHLDPCDRVRVDLGVELRVRWPYRVEGGSPWYPRGWRTLGRARIALALGERDEAVILLREAVTHGVRVMPGGGRFTLHTDPALMSLRGDPPLRPWLESGR